MGPSSRTREPAGDIAEYVTFVAKPVRSWAVNGTDVSSASANDARQMARALLRRDVRRKFGIAEAEDRVKDERQQQQTDTEAAAFAEPPGDFKWNGKTWFFAPAGLKDSGSAAVDLSAAAASGLL